MTYRKISGMVALAVALALPATALAVGTVLQGQLIGPSNTSGHGTVAYQANHGNTQAKLRIDVESLVNVDTALVVIHGQYVGTITLDANGNGSLRLSTRRGDSVPILQTYDVVDIYDATNTRVLLKGLVTAP